MERNEKKLRRTDKELFIMLFACWQWLEDNGEMLHKMLDERTDTGWRDVRLAQSLLNKTLTSAMDTAPVKDLLAIKAQMEHSVMEIRTRSVAVPPNGVWYLDTQQIADLVNAAIQNQCVTCDNTTGKGCGLKRVIEGLPIDISGPAINAYMACADRLEI